MYNKCCLRFNFTLKSVPDEFGDWGVSPKNGTDYDFGGQWAGVMGRVRIENNSS